MGPGTPRSPFIPTSPFSPSGPLSPFSPFSPEGPLFPSSPFTPLAPGKPTGPNFNNYLICSTYLIIDIFHIALLGKKNFTRLEVRKVHYRLLDQEYPDFQDALEPLQRLEDLVNLAYLEIPKKIGLDYLETCFASVTFLYLR